MNPARQRLKKFPCLLPRSPLLPPPPQAETVALVAEATLPEASVVEGK
jgi:hypothetical protein